MGGRFRGEPVGREKAFVFPQKGDDLLIAIYGPRERECKARDKYIMLIEALSLTASFGIVML
jgi:hypothetical protein